MIDFDNIDDWAPKLSTVLRPYVPTSVEQRLSETSLEFVEDAQDLLFDLTERDAVIDTVLDWLRSTKIAAYHASRLIDTEITSVQTDGLLPLQAETRRVRLTRALSSHPKWNEIAAQLDAVIQAHGQGGCTGQREGQVHLTLSRASLTDSFNQYLLYGSEFDRHVANALLGTEGKELLARDGKPTVIQCAVPGIAALDAAHSSFSIDQIRDRGEVPQIANQLLQAWSYRLANPGFQPSTLKVDCGMMFRKPVPATWIVSCNAIDKVVNPYNY